MGFEGVALLAEKCLFGREFVAAFDCPNLPRYTYLIRSVASPPIGYQMWRYDNNPPIGDLWLQSVRLEQVIGQTLPYAQVRGLIVSTCGLG